MMRIAFAFVTLFLVATPTTVKATNEAVGVRILAPHDGCTADDYGAMQSLLSTAYHQATPRRNLRSQQTYIEPSCQFVCAGLGDRCFMLHPACMKSSPPSDQRRRLDTSVEPRFHLLEDSDDSNLPTTCGEMRSLVETTLRRHEVELSDTCHGTQHNMHIQCFTLSFATVTSDP